MGKKLGRAKEIVGYATGDRDVEARGRVDQGGKQIVASDHFRRDRVELDRRQTDLLQQHTGLVGPRYHGRFSFIFSAW